jgi:Asp-tRNA(Asn)/Glu-tRNA(Gln) amidotransferase A subunit family amidase
MPIGLQINGRAFDEETVLAVAKAAESALGGFQKPPL